MTDVALNQELRITFSRPVDLASVNSQSFRVTDANGVTPPGEFLLDSNDASVLIYRPELSFDSSGNPVFGLLANESYSITVPGTANGDAGPYVTSQDGRENRRRLQCSVSSTLPVIDLKPGDPIVDVRVDVVTEVDEAGMPVAFQTDALANGAVDVFRSSPIRFRFSDVMNPGTLVNPVTGQSPTIEVLVDGDGSLGTVEDRVPLDGTFALDIDTEALVTTVTFQPELDYPSAGSDPVSPRRILVELPSTIADLGGNSLVNAGTLSFVPESITFDALDVVERFDNELRADLRRTGAQWSVDLGQGSRVLAPGLGGGSGRHGELVVRSGTTVVLSTDSEDFASIENLAVYDPIQQVRDPETQTPLVVTNGIFEFATLVVEAGGTLRFEGTNPARVFVRGECRVLGTLDVSGDPAPPHTATDCQGGVGGRGGPGGRFGGEGGDRPPTLAFSQTPNDGDIVIPSAPEIDCEPVIYVDNNATAGEGIPVPDALAPVSTAGAGEGGLAFPQPLGTDTFEFPVDPLDIDNQQYAVQFGCRLRVSGSPGGGGAYAGPGMSADLFVPGPQSALAARPPEALGGDASALGLSDVARALVPELGFLRGGSGGGGGGGHLQFTRMNGFAALNCNQLGFGETAPLRITEYCASSGAGGGGGGGALQLQAGRRLALQGVIDARGGTGGSNLAVPEVGVQSVNATPGGGGSGGAVLLQSRAIEFSTSPGRLDVRGGEGGSTVTASRGGTGSPGLVRLEALGGFDLEALVSPDCPNPFLCTGNQRINAPILPDPDALAFPVGENDPYEPILALEEVVTAGVYEGSQAGSGRVSGATSCWLAPEGNFFVLDFQADEVDEGGSLVTPGWDLELRLEGLDEPVSYRLPGVFPEGSIEELQAGLNFPPLVVRFQGARAIRPLENPCDVDLVGFESPLAPGSLTGWVEHPSELNDFFGGDPTRRPNVFRFLVVFDSREEGFNDLFQGVESLRVTARPD